MNRDEVIPTMKKKMLCIAVLFLLPLAVVSNDAEAATMYNYCQVPPYVIENIQPNIMLLVDNSGSMYNFAYACTSTTAAAAGSNTNVIPVASVAGFKVYQAIELQHSGTYTPLWITAINTTNNTLTVGANVTAFSANDIIKDEGCSDGNSYFYDQSSSSCPSTTSSCNNPGTYPNTTVSTAHSNSTTVTVSSATGFSVNESIIIVHSGTNYTRTITAISGTNLTINSSVTTSNGDVVKDSLYDTCHAYGSGANMLFSDVSGFSVGEVVVIVHGGTPNTATITSKSGNVLTTSPTVSISASDPVYDYNCYYYQTPYPEMSFDPTRDYYGYFNGGGWYTYTTSRFTQSRLKSAGAKASNEWDGNFMNWLTMRRGDIIKRALTGGNDVGADGIGYRKIRTINPESTGRGVYKAVSGAENYVGCAGCAGSVNFYFSQGSGDPSTPPANLQAIYGSGTTWTKMPSSTTYYTLDVQVPSPVAGVLQNTVGAKARVGLTVYAGNIGGKVLVPVNSNSTSLDSAVKYINVLLTNVVPTLQGGGGVATTVTNTPLGEALYSVVGYFKQDGTVSSSSGPMYTSGDYIIGSSGTVVWDPFNFGTSTVKRFPPCVQSYVLVITDGEPCSDGKLPSSIIGASGVTSSQTPFICNATTSSTCTGQSGTGYSFPTVTMPSCSVGGNVSGLEKVAYYMHTTNLRPIEYPSATDLKNLTGYFIFAFGQNSTLLKYAAINGGFDVTPTDKNPNTLNADGTSKWDKDGNGVPDNYYEASEGYALETSLDQALSTMLKRASSGTAASVLASGESSGANIVQAVFYPRRPFGNTIINWSGDAQNLWYYKDPLLTNSSIREDTVADKYLDLKQDYKIQLYFDTKALQTMAARYQDVNGDGKTYTTQSSVTLEGLSSVWKAGQYLFKRDPVATPRKLITTISSTNPPTPTYFSEANLTTLQSYLQLPTNNQKASDIIRFVLGYRSTSDNLTFDYVPRGTQPIIDRDGDGYPDYRLRTVKWYYPGASTTSTNIWKLGDIVNSTPKISSWIPLNTYDTRYLDTSYKNFANSSLYANRGLVFVGSNDGILHAFKLGKLVLSWTGQSTTQKAQLTADNPPDTYSIGDEEWGYIPKQVLPYLVYTADPDYCHLSLVDLTPMVFDASIGSPGSGNVSAASKKTGSPPHDCSGSNPCDWRSILIGGMRWGGANRNTNASCNSRACNITTSTSCTTSADCPSGETCDPNCVNTPLMDPSSTSKGLGYSSYFALDVTNQTADPVILWEFSDFNLANEDMGYATTGPAIVRVGNKDTNGTWYAVFGSGPTGPIDVNNYQFLGRSEQNLKYFIVDLKSGSVVTTIDTGIPNAFSGSLVNAAVDSDFDYQDDVVYVGYVKKCTSTSASCTSGTWTDGGIGAIVKQVDSNGNITWSWRKIMDGIGPVTSAVANLQDTRKQTMWLYFGTGRYYYEQTLGSLDDVDTQRYLIGVKDPCFDKTGSSSGLNNACASTLSLSDLADVTNTPTTTTEATHGWKLALDPSGNYTYTGDTKAYAYRAERVVTDTVATLSGNVIFVTYKPYNDECGVGGRSFVWGLTYNTGAAPGASLIGNELLQTSTGAITQLDLSKQLTLAGGRKTDSVEGFSSEGAGAIVNLMQPSKKVMHMMQR